MKNKKKNESSEILIDEADFEDYDEIDIEELDEEVIMARNKDTGFKRTGPSSDSESISKEKIMFGCTWRKCNLQLESEGLLRAHMNQHTLTFECNKCDANFIQESDLKDHIKSVHESREWNCNNCSFQASDSKELINHLQLSGHQPSPEIQNPRSTISHCYTCQEEFSSYWNLMNHRKQRHPSNRNCKYFLRNACVHGVNCWYRHDEPMETDFSSSKPAPSAATYKCGSCDKTFDNLNSQRSHRRSEHSPKQQPNATQTNAPQEQCKASGFQFPQPGPVPPESTQTQTIMDTLNMVLLKMKQMEEKFLQKTQ